jgi:hypothetical protein
VDYDISLLEKIKLPNFKVRAIKFEYLTMMSNPLIAEGESVSSLIKPSNIFLSC